MTFRGTTRNSLYSAALGANTPLIFNGIIRRTLLYVQAAAPGRKPCTMCERLTPFRSRCNHIGSTGQPNLSLSNINGNTSTFQQKKQAIFIISPVIDEYTQL